MSIRQSGQTRRLPATMPWVAFSDPQFAGVGLTEPEAIAAGHTVKASVLSLDNLPRALAARDTRGLIKLVADVRSDRLLGGVIVRTEVQTVCKPWHLPLSSG